jgi:hypothetical protein
MNYEATVIGRRIPDQPVRGDRILKPGQKLSPEISGYPLFTCSLIQKTGVQKTSDS